MIERLRGILVDKDAEGVVVDVSGVGYRAAVPVGAIGALPPPGEECVLHTRMVVREDAISLFGFATKEERAAFDALTAVSKIGPKLAVAVLSTLSPDEISSAVARDDAVKLATVPGLGKKTAERVVLELKGKDFAVFAPVGVTGDGSAVNEQGGRAAGTYMEAREALTSLGYSLDEAEQALRDVPEEKTGTVEGYVREALRGIGSRR
jgi:Holliday junction DNA helicase RuvA